MNKTTNNTINRNMNSNPSTASEYERKRHDKMEFYIRRGYKIFIDTCSLLDPNFPAFMTNVSPMLEKYNNKIIVPVEVNKELIKLYDKKPELRKQVIGALSLVKTGNGKYFAIMGDENDPFPDNLFQVLCSRFRREFNLLFITQDRSLAADLMNQNLVESVKAKQVAVKRIYKDGNLENLNLSKVNGFYVADKLNSNEMFNSCSEATDVPDDLVPVTEVPVTGDVVFAKRPMQNGFAKVELGERISSGGEGSVYRTNTEFVAKIYLEDKVTVRRRNKVLLMSSKFLNVEGVCFPVMSLFNKVGEFVGYLMEEAHGKELGKSVFLPFLKKEHPDWRKEDQVQLCLTIIDKVKELHRRNIYIGDINPANILVVSPKEVFFVDTDSYQIENYPCPVGQVYYTAPEIQGRKFDKFLRTESNENFALDVLLFQILMAGKHPYSHADNGGLAENIRNMEFPYNLGAEGTKQTPDGNWKYMWSHFPYDIKEIFYNTFWKDGKNAKENKRLEIGEWYKRMNKYLDMLQNGYMESTDPMSLTLYPNRLKATRNSEWTTCKCCGEKFPYNKDIKRKPKYCDVCDKEIQEVLTCADCGEEFFVTASEAHYLKEMGYELPKRCKPCRDKQKEKYKNMVPKAKAPKHNYGSLVFDCDIPSVVAPKPVAMQQAPKPVVTQAAPKPVVTQAAPKPVVTQAAPKPVVTQAAPKPVVTQAAPKPVVTQAAPKPVVTQAAPKPVVTQAAPKPVVTQAAPKPVVTQQVPVSSNNGNRQTDSGIRRMAREIFRFFAD